MLVDIVSIVIRAVSFIALFQAAGIVLCIAMLGRLLGQAQLPVQRTCIATAWIGIAMVLFYQWLAGARMTGEFSGLVDASMQMFALKSTGGTANTLRIAGLLLVIAILPRRGAGWVVASVVGATVVAMSFAVTGHTASHPQRWLLAPLLLTHLWVIAFWFGGLVPLYVASIKESPATAAQLIARFSLIATWLVPCIAVAGVVMALMLLPNVAALMEPYGLLLVFKAIGFALLMGFAALNKWRLGPAVASGDARAVQVFRRSVAIEYVLICLVMIATAVMTALFSPEP